MLFNKPILSFGAIYINPDVDIKGKSSIIPGNTPPQEISLLMPGYQMPTLFFHSMKNGLLILRLT